jgi:hypothetical protein
MKSITVHLLACATTYILFAPGVCLAQRGERASARQSVNRPSNSGSANRAAGGSNAANRGANGNNAANVDRNGSANRTADVNRNANVNQNVNVNRNVNVNQNVNVDRNVNVNANYSGGGYYGGGCCYHPVAAAATVTAAAAVTAAAIGSMVTSVPPSCAPVAVNGVTYQQCGSTWYQPQFSSGQTTYVVVNPPQ